MSYFKNLVKETFVTETAAPLPANKYKWYIYNADRATNITNTSGKRSVKLIKGSKFGVRQASNNKDYRVITEELGPNIVFTMNESKVSTLMSKGGSVTKSKEYNFDKLFTKHRKDIVEIFLDEIPTNYFSTDIAKWMIKSANLLYKANPDVGKSNDPFKEYGKFFKYAVDGVTKPNRIKKSGNTGEVDAAKKILFSIPKLIKNKVNSHSSLAYNINAAGEHLLLACALYAGDKKAIKRYSQFSSSGVRELLVNSVKKYLNDHPNIGDHF